MAQEKQQSYWYVLSGILNGIAILTKETALFPFGFLMLFAVLSPANKGQDWVATLRNVGMMLFGAVLIGVVALLPFVLSGAFPDFLDAAVVYTFQYVGDTSLFGRILIALLIVPPVAAVAGPWVVLSVLAVLHARRSLEPEKYWLLAGWLCASVAGIVFVGRFFPHYFAQLLPGMSLLVPLGLRFFSPLDHTSCLIH